MSFIAHEETYRCPYYGIGFGEIKDRQELLFPYSHIGPGERGTHYSQGEQRNCDGYGCQVE